MAKHKSVPQWYMTTWGFKKIRNKPYYRYVTSSSAQAGGGNAEQVRDLGFLRPNIGQD